MKIINLIKGLLKVEESYHARIEKYRKYFSAPSSSFFLTKSRFDFRAECEDRIYVSVGEKNIMNAVFTFETPKGEIKIGNNNNFGNVHFICRSKIEIENDVTMAWGITIYDHDSHSKYWEKRKEDNERSYEDFVNFNGNSLVNKIWTDVISKPIKIESKVWIGFNVTILKGVTIGEGAVIGAGSVVAKDVPAWSVAAGNPARVIQQLKST